MGEGGDAEPYYPSGHGFKYDIFFSYAHGNVGRNDDTALMRWSRQFHAAVIDDISTFLPKISIFLDESRTGIDGTVPIRPEIIDSVAASALFHLIMSPHYLESKWCQDELAAFVETLPDGPTRTKGRIFISKVLRTGDKPWPKALCDHDGSSRMKGWTFYPKGDQRPWGFGKDWKKSPPDEVMRELTRLVDALVDAVTEFEREAIKIESEAAQDDRLERGEIKEIYLYGREEDKDVWEAARDEITKLGVVVWPSEPEPLDVEDDNDKRIDYCRLAIRCDAMLMVATNGVKLDHDIGVIGRDRRVFITSNYKKSLPCAVIDRDGTLGVPARRGTAERFGIDWIDARTEDWPGCIRTWLQDTARKGRGRDGFPPIDPEEDPS